MRANTGMQTARTRCNCGIAQRNMRVRESSPGMPVESTCNNLSCASRCGPGPDKGGLSPSTWDGGQSAMRPPVGRPLQIFAAHGAVLDNSSIQFFCSCPSQPARTNPVPESISSNKYLLHVCWAHRQQDWICSKFGQRTSSNLDNTHKDTWQNSFLLKEYKASEPAIIQGSLWLKENLLQTQRERSPWEKRTLALHTSRVLHQRWLSAWVELNTVAKAVLFRLIRFHFYGNHPNGDWGCVESKGTDVPSYMGKVWIQGTSNSVSTSTDAGELMQLKSESHARKNSLWAMEARPSHTYTGKS